MSDAPERIWAMDRDIAEMVDGIGTEYVRADLVAAAVAAAREEGVRLGLLAAADDADVYADDAQDYGSEAWAVNQAANRLRALTADPAQVAAIAASVKGGE